MKFLCVTCDRVMEYAERRIPGDGTMAVVYGCPACGREIALLTNPMETRLVSGLGIQVGGRSVPDQPMELLRSSLATGGDAFEDGSQPSDPSDDSGAPLTAGSVRWSEDARLRLQSVPTFVRGMVKKIYGEYAAERGIGEITPEIMDRARTELGLEGDVSGRPDQRGFGWFRPSTHPPELARKFRQAAIAYLHYGVLYLFGAWALLERGLFPEARGPDWLWFGAGIAIGAVVVWGLWWWQNRWFARVIWVLVALRLPTLIEGAFLGSALDIAPGFYLAAGLVVLGNLWFLARAAWDV